MNVVRIGGNKVWGGEVRYVLDLCRALECARHSVAVRSAATEKLPYEAFYEKILNIYRG